MIVCIAAVARRAVLNDMDGIHNCGRRLIIRTEHIATNATFQLCKDGLDLSTISEEQANGTECRGSGEDVRRSHNAIALVFIDKDHLGRSPQVKRLN